MNKPMLADRCAALAVASFVVQVALLAANMLGAQVPPFWLGLLVILQAALSLIIWLEYKFS